MSPRAGDRFLTASSRPYPAADGLSPNTTSVEPLEPPSIETRVARLRRYVSIYRSLDEAAEALRVPPKTLEEMLNPDTATHIGLDLIAEALPPGFSI